MSYSHRNPSLAVVSLGVLGAKLVRPPWPLSIDWERRFGSMSTLSVDRTEKIPAGLTQLEGILQIPRTPQGIVLFAHGSGSGRYSERNKFVAKVLRTSKIGTLLFDLLTEDEAQDRRKVFDIDLLAQRLLYATEYVRTVFDTRRLGIGYFGASTGAAAALQASVMTDAIIHAIVSRGGRSDMVIPILSRVRAPTLIVVGGADDAVIKLNKEAYSRMTCEKQFKIIPGATHLFEEPGKLEEVARIAAEWFISHLH